MTTWVVADNEGFERRHDAEAPEVSNYGHLTLTSDGGSVAVYARGSWASATREIDDHDDPKPARTGLHQAGEPKTGKPWEWHFYGLTTDLARTLTIWGETRLRLTDGAFESAIDPETLDPES